MAIVSISRIQHRRGLQQDLPLLASAELGWSLDTQKLYIGNGTTAEGAPRTGVTEILTEHSDVLALAETYTFKNADAGYTPTTGGRNSRLNAIAYGASTYVAVGVNGGIVTSVDTVTWTPVYGGTSNTLNDVCFGDGKFVAVGASGTIIYSTDGSVWNKANTSVFLTLTGITYAGGAIISFVAISNTGSVITSSDAITWTVQSSGVTDSLNSIAYSETDGVLGVAGNNGIILSSTNAATWTIEPTPTNYNLKSINYTQDQWIATGEFCTILISPEDATDWQYGFADTFRASANNGTLWTLVGDGGIIYYIDTVFSATELNATTSPTTNNLNDVIYSSIDNQFVAIGSAGTILTSSDGLAWNTQSSGVSENLNKIIYDSANGLYVVVGNTGTILTSSDGVTWTEETSGVNDNLYGIEVWTTTTTYIAVGDGGTILTSSNGTSWTARVSGVSNGLNSVTISSTRAVVVGTEGTILTSDVSMGAIGVTWVARTGITTEDLHHVNYITYTINAVVYQNYYAVGNNATVIGSADGISWFSVTVPSTNHLFNIQYGIDKFWILGNVGYSTIFGIDINNIDSLTYQSLAIIENNTTGVNGPTLYSSSYGEGYYVVVGQYDTIYASEDGQNFISKIDRTFNIANLSTADILDIIYENNQFNAVGNKGLILTSLQGDEWTGISYLFGDNQTIRTIQKKLDDFVSVKDFGAKGDGLTDDTEAINRALYEIYCRTSAPAARKILWFPAGRYIVSDGINVPNNAILRGEGTNNTLIIQTADPSYVSYVFTTADSKQQIGAQIGYNGATLPSDILIADMGLRSNADGVWLTFGSKITFERISFIGNENLPTNAGDEWTGIYILGSTMAPPTDININDCYFEKYNYGIFQPDTEYSRNIVVNSCTFNNMFRGIYLTETGGMVNTMTVSNCIFDLIYGPAILTNYATNITSTFNSYRDVGNGYLGIGTAQDPVIDFGTLSTGCSSINDQFDRTKEESYTSGYQWVQGNKDTSAWFGGHEIRLGLYEQAGGETYTLTANVTDEPVGFSMLFNDDTYNKRIKYLIVRDGKTRIGTLSVSYNIDSGNHNIDDDSSETGDVGVVFGLDDDGTTIDLLYTSDNSDPADFDITIAEDYLKTIW